MLDTNDTMLMTYGREVGTMHFNFDPVQNNSDVLIEVFPATPAMVAIGNAAIAQGFQMIGITGCSAAPQAASIENVTNVGGHYRIVANFGDQFSELIGGSSLFDVKVPNPTYYLPSGSPPTSARRNPPSGTRVCAGGHGRSGLAPSSSRK